MSAIKQPTGIKMIAYRKDPEVVTPMTRQEYNDLRGWTVPADENPADAGFLIQGVESGGRMSWMAREQFEEAYQVVLDAKPATDPDWVLRLRAERTRYTKSLEKLVEMIRGPKFYLLAQDVQNVLKAHRNGMEGMREITNYRINHYEQVTAAAKTPD